MLRRVNRIENRLSIYEETYPRVVIPNDFRKTYPLDDECREQVFELLTLALGRVDLADDLYIGNRWKT